MHAHSCEDHYAMYGRINSTKSPASGAGTVGEPRLMSQVGRVREVVCALDQRVSAVRAVEVPVFVCLRRGSNHVTTVCETRTDVSHAN
jgi:hypothetical protein